MHSFRILIVQWAVVMIALWAPVSAGAQQSYTPMKQKASVPLKIDPLAVDTNRMAMKKDSLALKKDTLALKKDTLVAKKDTLLPAGTDAALASLDSLAGIKMRKGRDWSTWRPDSKKALWLALVLPGAGQIYNRKYWKLPLVYGGFVGCAYAMRWNNMMYKDYSQAYLDIMDDDPNTQSYNQFLHLGNKVDESNLEYYKNTFKKRKDRYRKWRDLSLFSMIGVYLLSVVDAYVDASLSEFDISKDLSLRVTPASMKASGQGMAKNPLETGAWGVQCALNF